MIKAHKGLSLIELMISMAIGLIIVAALAYIYLGTRQTYRNQDALARVQENGRYAMEILGRELRSTGYMGCVGNVGTMTTPAAANTGCTLSTTNTTCNTLNTPGAYAFNFGQPVQGFNANGVNWNPTLDSSLTGLSILAGTDVVTLRTADTTGVEVIQHPGGNPPGSANIKLTSTAGLSANDIILVSDCSYAAVLQISNINTGSNVVHNAGMGTPGNFSQGLGKEFVGGQVFKISSKTYFIRNGAGNVPSLWIFNHNQAAGGNNPQELVEGVENMQILYGEDNAGTDEAIDQYVTADNVTNWSNIRSVRIRLLMVSPENAVTDQAQTYLFDTNNDGALESVTATDRRLRYVFSSTIGIRNRLP